MQIIKVDLNDKAEVINLNDYIQVQQGDSTVPVQFVFTYNTDTVDMSDGKLGFINGITAGGHSIELEAPGNGAGQCMINLNGYVFQDAGAFKWLYIGVKDNNDNVITAVNATLTVKASNLDNGINTGDYRNDWQNFKNGLTNDVNKVSSEVNSASVQASAAASSASAAASSASAAANQADRTMDYLNYEISNKFDDVDKKVQDTINSLSVGGRNLLLASQEHDNELWCVRWDNAHANNGTYLTSNIYVTGGVWDGIHYRLDDLVNRGVINTSNEFTFSIYIKVEKGTTLNSKNFYFFNGNGVFNIEKDINFAVINENWTQISVTGKFTQLTPIDSGKFFFGFEISGDLAGGKIYLACPKLEKGNIPTDYSAAPEDIINELNSIGNNQLADTKLMNGASGSVKVQQLGNTVLVNLIANNVTSNDVVYQLPQNFKPKTLQQASSTESNSEGAYFDFFAIDAQGNISVCQRKFDNSVISKINCNATFSYFLD